MEDIFYFIRDMFMGYLGVLESIVFEVNGIEVNFLSLVVAFLIVGLIVAVFWKGAKT